MFKNYSDALFNDEVIIKSQQRFRVIIIKCTLKRLIR